MTVKESNAVSVSSLPSQEQRQPFHLSVPTKTVTILHGILCGNHHRALLCRWALSEPTAVAHPALAPSAGCSVPHCDAWTVDPSRGGAGRAAGGYRESLERHATCLSRGSATRRRRRPSAAGCGSAWPHGAACPPQWLGKQVRRLRGCVSRVESGLPRGPGSAAAPHNTAAPNPLSRAMPSESRDGIDPIPSAAAPPLTHTPAAGPSPAASHFPELSAPHAHQTVPLPPQPRRACRRL